MADKQVMPLIHLNGSGFKNLSEQYETALDALRVAGEALAQASPHGRDYYLHEGGDAFVPAHNQHASRRQRVQDVYDEIKAILLDLHLQNDGRR